MSDTQAEYIRTQRNRRALKWKHEHPDKVYAYRISSSVNFLRKLGYTVIEPQGKEAENVP